MTLEVVFAVIFRLIFVYLTAGVILSGVELLGRECELRTIRAKSARSSTTCAQTEAGSLNGTNGLFRIKCYFYFGKSIKI